MNQDLLERILRCPTLPSLPAVAIQIVELTRKPNISMDELARTIQNDQALSAKILKTVNSSFYGLRRPCTTIGQAMVMLGMASVKSLALGFSLVSSVGTSSKSGFDFVAYWRRALYSAVAARCIARDAGVTQEEEAFLGGLLQDVGMVAMHQALGDEYLEMMARTGGDHRKLTRHELAALEIQHADVGAMLAQRWRLPDDLILPVKYHECPTAAPPEHAAVVRCVGLGNIAHDVLTDPDPMHALNRFHRRAADWFGMSQAAADDLIGRVAEGAAQVAPLFRLDTGSLPDPAAIMAKAKEQVSALAARPRPESTASPSMYSLLSDSEEYDPITGVLGRTALLDYGERALETGTAGKRSLAALFIQVDGLAGRPELTTEASDAVLVESALLIESLLGRFGGIVGRFAESAFMVLALDMDRAAAVRAATELRSAFDSQSGGWAIPGLPGIRVSVSVGVAATGPGQGPALNNAEQLAFAARRAAEAAAAGGGNCIRSFVPKQAA